MYKNAVTQQKKCKKKKTMTRSDVPNISYTISIRKIYTEGGSQNTRNTLK